MLAEYWKLYGGFRAFLSSRYLLFAVVFSGILYPAWWDNLWWDDVLSVIPSILGFSLGGYAMWLAIGNDDFRRFISGNGASGRLSPFISVNATFVHFIVVQLLSLLLAITGKSYYFELPTDSVIKMFLGDALAPICRIGSFIGFTVFLYALCTALAATLAIFRASRWYDQYVSAEKTE